MKTCETCKHWQKPGPQQPSCLPLGECGAVLPANYDSCSLHTLARFIERRYKVSEKERKLVAETRAAVDGPGGEVVVLLTRADFGCVLHEEGGGT